MSLTRRVFTAAALTASLALSACGGGSSSGPSGNVEAGQRSLGSADAPVTMIEYASVACPHCATFHEEVSPLIESEFIETGQVQYVFREMVTGSPQFAIAGFSLARCVADEHYFDMLDLLFQQQRAIFQAGQAPGGARNQYLAIARSMGLSESEFDACMTNEDIQRDIIEAHNAALDAGINSTPRFLFNGELLESRRAPGETDSTFFLGGQQILIDGEPLPGRQDAETFRRLLTHLVAQASASE